MNREGDKSVARPTLIDLIPFDFRLASPARFGAHHREKCSFCLYRKHLPEPDCRGSFSPFAGQSPRHHGRFRGRACSARATREYLRGPGAAGSGRRHFGNPQPAPDRDVGRSRHPHFCDDRSAPGDDPPALSARRRQDLPAARIRGTGRDRLAGCARSHRLRTRCLLALCSHDQKRFTERARVRRTGRTGGASEFARRSFFLPYG